MRTHFSFWVLLLAGVFLVTGCVGVEDYERKVSESTSLRKELEAAQARIGSLENTIEDLRKQGQTKRLEGEELSQSLTMSRRNSQQLESRLADLRAQLSAQTQDNRSAQEKLARLEKNLDLANQESRALEKNNLELRKRVARFEDKLRLQIQLEKDLSAQFSSEISKRLVTVKRTGERVIMSLESSLLFSSGSANIRRPGQNLLKKIAVNLRRYTNREIQVEGHTDNVPISDRLAEKWESNWELSAWRATRVLRYLVEVGNVDPRKISAAGFGEFQPIADNSSQEGRAKNRRIEIVLFPPSS